MGGGQSTVVPGGGSEGYHVLKVSECSLNGCVIVRCLLQVLENSPGYQAGLEPYFDYIVSINDIRLVGHIKSTPQLFIFN